MTLAAGMLFRLGYSGSDAFSLALILGPTGRKGEFFALYSYPYRGLKSFMTSVIDSSVERCLESGMWQHIA